MTTVDILEKAKVLLETEGWIQGNYKLNTGYCLSGAVSHALPLTEERIGSFGARHVLCEVIKSELVDKGLSFGFVLEAWNDTKGRTKEEVLAVVDKAILVAKAAT